MNNLNRFVVAGYLVKDPEIKNSKNGKDICVFSVGNTTSYQSGNEWKENRNFFNCIAFGKLKDAIMGNLHKGDFVMIDGKINMTSFDKNGEKRTNYILIVNEINFQSKKKDEKPSVDVTSDEYPF